ncbi:uncharacterized protein LOC132461148 [Gadus macrocephalus]|uniref:uncharacterized protein LOC132461148 n=1 Tax=Gadus macrocephalus TaxID=80720 RepID=UPI0028CB3AF0|nr:uncharacterized protein LOC132461148 [Gadus macrocephalus]
MTPDHFVKVSLRALKRKPLQSIVRNFITRRFSLTMEEGIHQRGNIPFDLREGLTTDEWLRQLSPEKEQNNSRHAELRKEEVDQLEKERNEFNTVKQTRWAVKCLEEWCAAKDVDINFATISKERLNCILRDFYATVRNGKGQTYGLSSFIGLRAGINRYINDPPLSLSWCLIKNTDFTTSNNVFTGVVKTMRKKGLDTTVHHLAICEEDLNAMKKSLDPGTAGGLVDKVWFDVQLHFGRRGTEGNRQLKPSSFAVKSDENGLKYATLTFNEHTKNHNDPQGKNRENTRGFMYQLPGDPLCPVSSLLKYISHLPPDAEVFYVHPRKNIIYGADEVWYTREPMGVNHLAKMLPKICKQAGTRRYTNHCLRSTTIQMQCH